MKKTPDPASILQDLRKVPSNKRCFDCQQAGTTYTIVDFGIFLCSICGGLHREFNHRVKGLSTCNFSAVEVEKLQQWGNEKATQVWMAKHDIRSYPIPDIKDQARLRDFIRLKYQEKRWYDESKAENNQRRQEPVVKAGVNAPQAPPVSQPQYQTYAQPPPAQQAPAIKSLIDFEEEPKSTETWSGFQQPQNIPAISRPQNTQAIPKPPGQEPQYQNPPQVGQFGIFDPGYYQGQQTQKQVPQNPYGQSGGNTPNQYQNPQVNNGGYSPQTGNVGGPPGGYQSQPQSQVSFPPPQNMQGNWNQAQRNTAPVDTSPKVQQIPYNYQNPTQAPPPAPSFPSFPAPQPQSTVPTYNSPPQSFTNPYPPQPTQLPQNPTFPNPYQQPVQTQPQNNPFPSQYTPQPQNFQNPHQPPQPQNNGPQQRPQPAPVTTSFPGQYSQPPLQSPPRNNYPPQPTSQNPLTDVSFTPYPSQEPRNPSYPQTTNYQQAPANQDPFSHMQNNVLSSGIDPFAQLVEEEKKKAHIIHPAKPQNAQNSGNSNVLMQQYQMMAQMYQSSHGIPYPYTFQQWYAIVNPQPTGVPVNQAPHIPSQASHIPSQNPGYKHVETGHMHEKPKSNNPFDLFT